MKRLFLTTLGLVVAVALSGTARAEDAKVPAGQKLFLDNKCNSCHSVSGAGIEKKSAEAAEKATADKAATEKTAATPTHKAPDLSSIGTDQKADWMAKFLKKEVAAKDGKKHMKLWKGTDADLKTLTEWLGDQKAEKKAEATEEKAPEAAAPAATDAKAAAPATDNAATPAPADKAPETKAPDSGK
jgi:cbb3-type cytochrome oxidase cytochrome c subunit